MWICEGLVGMVGVLRLKFASWYGLRTLLACLKCINIVLKSAIPGPFTFTEGLSDSVYCMSVILFPLSFRPIVPLSTLFFSLRRNKFSHKAFKPKSSLKQKTNKHATKARISTRRFPTLLSLAIYLSHPSLPIATPSCHNHSSSSLNTLRTSSHLSRL